jgi:ABC-type transport system involved in multi-copper enzyme maturation permease subunit
MIDLLKIEFKKIIPYTTFWVIFIIIFALTPIVFYGAGQFKIDGLPIDMRSIYTFPSVWHNLTYLASWFNLLIGMFLVILVCNEFSFKTFRQHVIDGQNRGDFIISKILLMTSIAIISTFYLFVVGSLFGLISGNSADGMYFSEIKYLAVYFIQALGYMTVGMMIAILIRSSALSIIIFIFSIILESIIQAFIPDSVDQYFPMEIIANLTPNPLTEMMMPPQMPGMVVPEVLSLNTTLMVAIAYIFAFWGISYFILSKKDIK